jgi:hypothetical protein
VVKEREINLGNESKTEREKRNKIGNEKDQSLASAHLPSELLHMWCMVQL